jgi:Cu(I)/Ag(I) efflux system membrane fusion protein/cobalt-zinc-cadmium efflux system membrane fusion protein
MNRRQIDLVSQDWKVGIRNSEVGTTTQPTVNAESGHAAFRAVLWALVGAVVMALLIVDPIGVSPVDDWLGVALSGEVGHGDEQGDGLWTCGMHPEVIENEPGICPICHMDLTPLRTDSDVGHGDGGGHGSWTCTMHPMIEEAEPGECPICGMELVQAEVEESGHGFGRGTEVVIDPTVVQNMNVVTRTVERRDIAHRIRTVGYLEYDQEGMVSVTTKYPGFIEKTHVSTLGQPIRKGQPLFEIYSPELVQTERELLAALRYARNLEGAPADTRQRALALIEAARQRLRYWDISPEQLRKLEATGEVFRTLEVLAPASGVVMKRMKGLEGMAVQPGMELLHIADLSNLWLTAEIFDHQLPWLDVGSRAEIAMSFLPGTTISGRVRSIEPEVSEQTRTVRLTLDVPNRNGDFRVGMYATVLFDPVAARDALTIPAEAVIRTGQRDLVVVALGEGRFAPHEVVLGASAGGSVQVLEGLTDGDEVVTSAQFLIDSESNLREAVNKLISGHQHGGGS